MDGLAGVKQFDLWFQVQFRAGTEHALEVTQEFLPNI